MAMAASETAVYAVGAYGEFTEAECQAAMNCDCGYRDGCSACHRALEAMGVIAPASGPVEVSEPSYAPQAPWADQDITAAMDRLASRVRPGGRVMWRPTRRIDYESRWQAPAGRSIWTTSPGAGRTGRDMMSMNNAPGEMNLNARQIRVLQIVRLRS